jgi:hypothetical protein
MNESRSTLLTCQLKVVLPKGWAYAAGFCALLGFKGLANFIIDKTMKLGIIK